MARYSRIFALQHYIRALYQRHAGALQTRKACVNQALGSFLDVSINSIESDLALIASRLGEEWYLPASHPLPE